MSSIWTQLHDAPPGIQSGAIITLNQFEFLLATRYRSRYDKNVVPGIYKYNINTKQWALFIKYPPNFEISGPKMIYDKATGKLWLHGSDIHEMSKTMSMIDLNSHLFTHFPNNSHEDKCGTSIGMTDTGNDIHMIGGWGCINHIVFNKNTHTFKKVHSFNEFSRIYGPCAMYIPWQESILLIGGSTGKDIKVNMRIYSLKTKTWKVIENILFHWYHVRAVLTSDQKYVIITAVYSKDSIKCDKIWILDLNDYSLRMSKIETPTINVNPTPSRNIVILGDSKKSELLVKGYVRIVLEKNKNIIYPPKEIIALFKMFYSSEMLHVVRFSREGKKEHFVTPVQNIFQFD